jgi:pimeloyl-ACP methyl ester carboxylesterase
MERVMPSSPRARGAAPHAVALAVVVALALVAAACGQDLDAFGGLVVRRDRAGATPAATPEPPPTFLSYRAVACPVPATAAHGLAVDCSELTVPMRRDRSSTHNVTLTVARVHSSSPTPRPDPVVYLEGGPGGSSISSLDIWTSPPAPFLADRDLILVDQRGTGYSKPRLTCDQLTDELYGPVVVSVTEDCVRMLQNSGVDLGAFDSTESALDLYDLRRAMQIKEWNLFGISYGTRLALWTLQTRPQGIRSVVVDSVYPPGVKATGTHGAHFLRAVRALAADCAAQPACAGAHPDVEGDLTRAVDRLNAATPGRGDAFARFVFQAMYDTGVETVIPRALGLAAAGRVEEAAELIEGAGRGAGDDASPGIGSRPHMSDGLYQSVECAETTPLSTSMDVRQATAGLPPQVGKPFQDVELRLLAVCNVWKVEPNPLTAVHSDVPVLVMAGTYDPITPPEWAELAAATLPRATYQLVQGSGHGVWLAGDCPQQKVTQFLQDPAAPGPACPGAPPAFA